MSRAHSADAVGSIPTEQADAAVLVFTASVTATITVPATDENLARYAILETLQDADTDFIRTDHWERSGILAEFHIDQIGEARTALETGSVGTEPPLGGGVDQATAEQHSGGRRR